MAENNKIHQIFFTPRQYPEDDPDGDNGWKMSSGTVKMSSSTHKMSSSGD